MWLFSRFADFSRFGNQNVQFRDQYIRLMIDWFSPSYAIYIPAKTEMLCFWFRVFSLLSGWFLIKFFCFLSSFRLDFNGFYKEKLEAMSAERAMMESSMHSTDSGKKKERKKTLSETLVSDCKVFCIVCTPHSLESGKSVGCQEDTVEF